MIKQIKIAKVVKEVLERLISGSGFEASLEKTSIEEDEGEAYLDFQKNRESIRNYTTLLKDFH